jgi:peroxiredoxin family protein
METGAVTQTQTAPSETKQAKKVTIIVFSGDLDRVLASFIIATGAASMGQEVTMFFTFWGLNVLRKEKVATKGKGLMRRMLSWMNKGGTNRLPLSKFHMFGAGTAMMKKLMQESKMPSVEEMFKLAKQMGVKIIACTVTMGVLGIDKETLRDEEIDGYAGVVTYLAEAQQASVNLFI